MNPKTPIVGSVRGITELVKSLSKRSSETRQSFKTTQAQSLWYLCILFGIWKEVRGGCWRLVLSFITAI